MTNMTEFEINLKQARDDDKIVYYDYLAYKRAAGWWTGLYGDDWHRPTIINKAKYYGEFLFQLPQYYFLGFPIKELLKNSYANGVCHACAIALSLYFKNFEIITCNLQNYADYYTIVSGAKTDYEHTFLQIISNDKKIFIDTTFGFITDSETYKKIFNPNDIRIISSEEIKKVEPYQFIKSLKDYSGPPLGFNEVYDEENQKWYPTDEELKYQEILRKYMDMCRNYKNPQNPHLTDFINRCLFRTSHNQYLENWRECLQFNETGNTKYEYPKTNLFSLDDDEFDENLYSTYKDTICRNEKVLLSYHNQNNNEDNNLSYENANVKIKVRNFMNKMKSHFI